MDIALYSSLVDETAVCATCRTIQDVKRSPMQEMLVRDLS